MRRSPSQGSRPDAASPPRAPAMATDRCFPCGRLFSRCRPCPVHAHHAVLGARPADGNIRHGSVRVCGRIRTDHAADPPLRRRHARAVCGVRLSCEHPACAAVCGVRQTLDGMAVSRAAAPLSARDRLVVPLCGRRHRLAVHSESPSCITSCSGSSSVSAESVSPSSRTPRGTGQSAASKPCPAAPIVARSLMMAVKLRARVI